MQHNTTFEVKQRVPLELNDRHGSYICELGHVHDYSRIDLNNEEIENTKIYNTLDEVWADLDTEDD